MTKELYWDFMENQYKDKLDLEKCRHAIFKIDNQQGPRAEHRELCSVLRGSLDGRGAWGRMDTCICLTGSLGCALETVTALFVNYTPI